MTEIIEKMTNEINNEIAFAYRMFNENDCRTNESIIRENNRIHGMIAMLTIVTGKEYIITADGIVERG